MAVIGNSLRRQFYNQFKVAPSYIYQPEIKKEDRNDYPRKTNKASRTGRNKSTNKAVLAVVKNF